jgi:hypothetical protein
MRSINFLLVAVALLLVASCSKPTVESETKRWEAAKTNLETLIATYPGFKLALDQVKSDANAQWESALKIAEEEKKIEAMKATVLMVSRSFVRPLSSISAKIEKLKDLSTEATQAGSVDNADKEALRIAQNEANITLNNVESILKNREVTTAVQATAIIEDVDKQLASASKRIKKVMDTVASKKNAAKAASDTAAANKAKDETVKEEAKKPVKCPYCNTMNPPDALKCSSCGAPVEN